MVCLFALGMLYFGMFYSLFLVSACICAAEECAILGGCLIGMANLPRFLGRLLVIMFLWRNLSKGSLNEFMHPQVYVRQDNGGGYKDREGRR